MEKVLVSTVTPVYRGADTLDELVGQLDRERRAWERDNLPLELVEAIFVDDASADESLSVLDDLAARHAWVHVVPLSRNFGQHPATVAGILHSSGDWVATLDEDLQHEPRFVLALLKKAIEKGWDVTYAKPLGRVHESLFRDQSSKLYKTLMAMATGNPNVRDFNSFRMIRGSIGRAAASVATHDTYFDVALGWFTKRLGSLPLAMKDHRYIHRKASGYGFFKLLSHARRLLVSSQTKSLRLGATIGVGALIFSAGLAFYILATKLLDPAAIDVRGWLSLFLAIVFFGGLCSFLVGVVLEYLSTLLLRSQGKPTFFVVDRSKDAMLRDTLARYDRHDTAPSASTAGRAGA